MISQRLAEKLVGLAYTDDQGALQFVELHEGEVLFEQGDEANNLYVLKAGVLGVRVRREDGGETTIARLAPGAIVGEMALLSGNKRSATVYAINDAGLICISQGQFEQLMMEDEAALAEMSETAEPRWQRQQLFDALYKLLGKVDIEGLEALRQQLTWHYFGNGDVVFQQGAAADGMYIVVNGRLRATLQRGDGSRKDLGRIGPGEPVGEMAMLTDAARSATVHAVRESSLVKITTDKFERLIRQYPKLLIHIARVIVERQQRLLAGTEAEQAGPLTLAVIPAAVNLDALQFAQEFAAALAICGATLVLDAAGFDEEYGEDLASQTEMGDVGHTAVVAFMNKLDLAAPYIIYVADPFASAWTRRCIGHADRVLVLADPAGEPQPGDAEGLLAQLAVPPQRDLVFWGSFSPEKLPDSSAWSARRPQAGLHFVRRGDGEQLAELVRRLTTKKTLQ